jgi:hypothetical protein
MVLHEMAALMRHPARDPAAAHRLQLAMLDPDTAYAAPTDVLVDHTLSRASKIALLRNWKDDLEQRSLAREEGMVGRDESLSRELAAVTSALERIAHV